MAARPSLDDINYINWIRNPIPGEYEHDVVQLGDNDLFITYQFPHGCEFLTRFLALNRLYRELANLVNTLYRADYALNKEKLTYAAPIREESFQKIQSYKGQFTDLVTGIYAIGGHDFPLPVPLWPSLSYLWFELEGILPAKLKVSKAFHDLAHFMTLPPADINSVITYLKMEKFDQLFEGKHVREEKLLIDWYENMRTVAVTVYRRRQDERAVGLPVLQATDDLLKDLQKMEKVAEDLIVHVVEDNEPMFNPIQYPTLLKSATRLLTEYIEH